MNTEENQDSVPQLELSYKTPWGTIEPIESVEWETQCHICGVGLTDKNSSGWETFVSDEDGVVKSRKLCDACFAKSGPKPGEKIYDKDGNVVGTFG